MKKRVVGLLSVFLCFCMMCSCDSSGEAKVSDSVGHRITVAVKSDSDELLAAEAYSSRKGLDIVKYNETSDAVAAVLNGKADYVVLNEYDSYEYLDAGNKLDFVESTEYKIEHVAWFNAGNEQLSDEFNKALDALEQEGVLLEIKEANLKGKAYTYDKSNPIKGELVMLCDPVFENIICYSENGDIRGTDYDIARAVCSYLGYSLAVEVVDFDRMFVSLEAGEGDFIMSASQYTSERAGFFIASDVYSSLNYNVYKRMT